METMSDQSKTSCFSFPFINIAAMIFHPIFFLTHHRSNWPIKLLRYGPIDPRACHSRLNPAQVNAGNQLHKLNLTQLRVIFKVIERHKIFFSLSKKQSHTEEKQTQQAPPNTPRRGRFEHLCLAEVVPNCLVPFYNMRSESSGIYYYPIPTGGFRKYFESIRYRRKGQMAINKTKGQKKTQL